MKSSITFVDYLKQLQSDIVFERLVKKSKVERSVISTSTLKSIAASFSSRESLGKTFAGLSLPAQKTCAVCYLSGSTGVAVESLNGFSDELLGSFLVYAVTDDIGYRYMRFDEFADAILPSIAGVCAGSFVDKKGTAQSASWPFRVLNDALLVLHFFCSTDYKKTKTNTLLKSSHIQLQKLVFHGLGRAHPLSINLDKLCETILSFGLSHGLLRPVESHYLLDHEAIIDWFSRPPTMCLTELLDWFLTRGICVDYSFLCKLFSTSPRAWLNIDLVFQGRAAELKKILWPLEFLGVIDISYSGRHTLIRQSLGAEVLFGKIVAPLTLEHGTFLPDFSAVFPQEISPIELDWFMYFGTILSLDHVYKGKIRKEVIADSLYNGIKAETLLKKCVSWNLPKNIAETIKEWVREFNRVGLYSQAVIVSADDRVTRQILAYEPLRELVEVVAGNSIFRVRPGQEQRARILLEEMGFDPRVSIVQGNEQKPIDFPDNDIPAKSPVINFKTVEAALVKSTIRSGKYSAELKALDLSEMFHILDYSILMGHLVRFSYKGNKSIKRGIYTVKPLICQRDAQSILEAEDPRTNAIRRFHIDLIERIGVQYT